MTKKFERKAWRAFRPYIKNKENALILAIGLKKTFELLYLTKLDTLAEANDPAKTIHSFKYKWINKQTNIFQKDSKTSKFPNLFLPYDTLLFSKTRRLIPFTWDAIIGGKMSGSVPICPCYLRSPSEMQGQYVLFKIKRIKPNRAVANYNHLVLHPKKWGNDVTIRQFYWLAWCSNTIQPHDKIGKPHTIVRSDYC